MRLIGELVARNEDEDQSSTCRSRAAWPGATTLSRTGVAPTVFMMSNPLVTVDAGAGGKRRGRGERGGQPLAALRHQGDLAAAQRAAAPAGGGCGRGRNPAAARRLPHRRRRQQHFRGARRRPAGAAERQPDAARHHLRRDPGTRRRRHPSKSRCGASASTKCRTAQELWLTSSTKEVLAITHLDGKPVGGRQAGPAVPRRCIGFTRITRTP